MRHPTPGELLELHFGESRGSRAGRLSAHARSCPQCRQQLFDLAWAERLLAVAPGDWPPVDGLERVMAAVEGLRPPVRSGGIGLRAALPAAGALLAGALAVALGGVAAAGLVLAAGTLVTLSLAPTLILEARNEERTPHTAAR